MAIFGVSARNFDKYGEKYIDICALPGKLIDIEDQPEVGMMDDGRIYGVMNKRFVVDMPEYDLSEPINFEIHVHPNRTFSVPFKIRWDEEAEEWVEHDLD